MKSLRKRGAAWWWIGLVWSLMGAVGTGWSASPGGATGGVASRDYGVWTSGRIGGGGYLQQVVFAPSDPRRVYVSSDVGGVFRSEDGGGTWRMLHDALPAEEASYSIRGLLVDPRDADRVLIAADHGVWRSTDAGRSWRRVLEARFAGNGPHRADGGVLVFAPGRPERVLAAALGGVVAVSDDGGETWRSHRVLPESAGAEARLAPVDLRVDACDARRLWLSARAGTFWLGGREEAFAGGLFRSEDGGETWARLAAEGMREIVQAPGETAEEAGALIALTPGRERVVRSTDGGVTWREFTEGLAPPREGWRSDGAYGALATGPDFVLLGGNGASIYRLDRGARAWRKVPWERERIDEGDWWGALGRHGYPHFGSALGFLALDPSDPERRWALTDWYGFYQTRDVGRSWKLDIAGIELTVVHDVTQDAAEPGRVHAGLADVGYFRSEDGAENFARRSGGIGNNIKRVVSSPARPGRLYATGPSGSEWQANQVFVSDDGGDSWRRAAMRGLPDMRRHRCNSVATHPRRADEVWLAVDGATGAGAGGIWRSGDAGENWVWAGEGLPEGERLFRTDIWVAGPEIAVSANGGAVAASDDRGRVFFRDEAETWREVPAAGFGGRGGVNAVVADAATPGRFYLCRKEGGLWRSEDGGRTWARLSAKNAWAVAVDAAGPRRVAFNGAEGIWWSEDGGAGWARLDAGLPYRAARNVVAFAGERLVVGTGGNGVFFRDLREPAQRFMREGPEF